LKSQEQAELDQIIRCGANARQVRRAQMIRMSSLGKSAAEIAEVWNIHVRSVLRILRNFHQEGIASLEDKPRSGRPPKTTELYVAVLKEAVASSPRDMGYPFSSWTLDRLREHLGRKVGILLHPSYLSRLMARHEIVYRRPKHVMAHLRNAQEYDEKKALLDFLKKTRSSPKRTSTCCTSTSVRFTSTRP
jgi:transposase